jgi:hypothetical protein
VMKAKITPEPIVQEIFQDTTTQYLIQQELQETYDSLERIRLLNNLQIFLDELQELKSQDSFEENNIIYMPQEELERLEEPKQDNKFQEEVVYENI